MSSASTYHMTFWAYTFLQSATEIGILYFSLLILFFISININFTQ